MPDGERIDLELVWAQEACRRLIRSSVRLVDAGEFAEMARLFTSGAQLIRPNGESLQGRDAIEQSYRNRPANRVSRHLLFDTDFVAIDAMTMSAVTQVLLWTADAVDQRGPFGLPAHEKEILGKFSDVLILTGQQWLIGKRTATFEMFRECRDEARHAH